MKKIFILSILSVLLTVSSSSVIAFADNMTPKGIDVVMNEIRQEQSLKMGGKIILDKVSPSSLEKLGDSVMEAMIANSDVHDKMDKDLGGDGSASLTAFHQRIGYNYLFDYPNGMMNILSSGMLGNNRYGMMRYNRYEMMDNFGVAQIIICILFFVLIVVVLFFVIKAILKRKSALYDSNALDILKIRYAKGEISQEDFDKIKKTIQGS